MLPLFLTGTKKGGNVSAKTMLRLIPVLLITPLQLLESVSVGLRVF